MLESNGNNIKWRPSVDVTRLSVSSSSSSSTTTTEHYDFRRLSSASTESSAFEIGIHKDHLQQQGIITSIDEDTSLHHKKQLLNHYYYIPPPPSEGIHEIKRNSTFTPQKSHLCAVPESIEQNNLNSNSNIYDKTPLNKNSENNEKYFNNKEYYTFENNKNNFTTNNNIIHHQRLTPRKLERPSNNINVITALKRRQQYHPIHENDVGEYYHLQRDKEQQHNNDLINNNNDDDIIQNNSNNIEMQHYPTASPWLHQNFPPPPPPPPPSSSCNTTVKTIPRSSTLTPIKTSQKDNYCYNSNNRKSSDINIVRRHTLDAHQLQNNNTSLSSTTSTTSTTTTGINDTPAYYWRSNKQQQQQQQQQQNESLVPNITKTIVAAIRALYVDELRPTIPELRRRLTEFKVPPTAIKDLMGLCCKSHKYLRADLNTQEVFLIKEPAGFKGFVDPKDPHDPFDCCTWHDFNEYVVSLVRDTEKIQEENSISDDNSISAVPENNDDNLLHYQFQGGRYGMAGKMIKDFRLKSERLKSLSMGRLCHLIQLSIAYGIMQYENNILQPRATCLRIAAAFAQSDLEPEGGASRLEALKDAEAVKLALKEVLRNHPNAMLLSQLKFAFENGLSSRLCQSVFGCTRLSNLLQLPLFRPICRILTDKFSRVLVQSIDFPIPSGMRVLSHEERFASENMTDEKAKRNVAIPFHELSAPCCFPRSRNLTFLHWRLCYSKLNELILEDCNTERGRIVYLGTPPPPTITSQIITTPTTTTTASLLPKDSYSDIVHSILHYLDDLL